MSNNKQTFNTAKVEIDFIKATESNKDTGFMRLENKD